ncbi:MAG: secondary thiamine-phosphate synthase enzyme YjbQ [Planctomycetota bacterium]|jgi:thiamine phosphate synthase YjbQ (UPF0047 family)
MKSHRKILTFEVESRKALIHITDPVAEEVRASGIQEGLCLVSAMHITAGVFVNDNEGGIHADFSEWLESLTPYGSYGVLEWPDEPGPVQGRRVAYRHHLGGEDNGDAHLKSLLIGNQTVLPVTDGALDLGTWQRIFYAEYDGKRRKRVIIKIIGE